MNSVCIIGAGTMGVGIAQWFANIGLQVFITDSKSEVLDVAKESITTSYEKLIQKNKFTILIFFTPEVHKITNSLS